MLVMKTKFKFNFNRITKLRSLISCQRTQDLSYFETIVVEMFAIGDFTVDIIHWKIYKLIIIILMALKTSARLPLVDHDYSQLCTILQWSVHIRIVVTCLNVMCVYF